MCIESALVTFSARPMVSENQEITPNIVDIVGHYPSDTQWAEVARDKGTKEVSLKPNFSFSILGFLGSVDGIGVKKYLGINQVSTISLKPTQVTLKSKPTQLRL
jgi:hypothetical protein